MLKIKTTPPLAGSNVWLRSFDVDDTTEEKGLDNAGVIDPNGRSGDDNFYQFNPPYGYGGLFVTNNTSSCSVTLNANGEALVEMRVGMQPGDNYRVAATVFPANNLGSLQSGTASGDYFVSAYTDQIRGGFNGALSPLLTVWRKLHMEFDSMAAVPSNGPQANFTTQRVWAIQTNQPVAGQTTVWLTFTSPPWEENQFENGTLTIAGIAGSYPIAANRSQLLFVGYFYGHQNSVVVSGLVSASAVKAPCILRDDDERWVVSAALPELPMDGYSQQFVDGFSPSLGSKRIAGIAETYAPAFVAVVDANQLGWNPRRIIPFYLNRDVFDNPLTLSSVFDDAKDLADNDVFWAHTVTFGFQPAWSEDGDPNAEPPLLGATPETPGTATAFGYSAVYKEAMADDVIEYRAGGGAHPLNQHAYYEWLLGCCAHETGHAPGAHFMTTDHTEGKLMKSGGEKITGKKSFSPVSIRRFRTARSWTGGTP
jgi:hypothetical protein